MRFTHEWCWSKYNSVRRFCGRATLPARPGWDLAPVCLNWTRDPYLHDRNHDQNRGLHFDLNQNAYFGTKNQILGEMFLKCLINSHLAEHPKILFTNFFILIFNHVLDLPIRDLAAWFQIKSLVLNCFVKYLFVTLKFEKWSINYSSQNNCVEFVIMWLRK